MFTIPAISERALEQLRHESNPAHEFLTVRYVPGSAEDRIRCSDLHAAYTTWCAEQRLKPLHALDFGKEVRKAFPQVRRGRESTGDREWRYEGIRPVNALAGDAPSLDIALTL